MYPISPLIFSFPFVSRRVKSLTILHFMRIESNKVEQRFLIVDITQRPSKDVEIRIHPLHNVIFYAFLPSFERTFSPLSENLPSLYKRRNLIEDTLFLWGNLHSMMMYLIDSDCLNKLRMQRFMGYHKPPDWVGPIWKRQLPLVVN